MDKTEKTKELYGFLWGKADKNFIPEKWHFDAMQSVIDEPIVRGSIGLEIGCGCGYDSYIMAKRNPSVKLVSLDASEGIYKAKEFVSGLKNVKLMQCSALALAIKDRQFDFVYSFGVLHHTTDPMKGFLEIARVLKIGSPAFLYLYEDHSENLFKFIAIKLTSLIRLLSSRIPHKLLYMLSFLASPVVYVFFSLPAKIFRKFKCTENLAKQMPFNFAKGPFSLQGDLYDRFGSSIEYRFSRRQLSQMFKDSGFSDIHITRLKDTAGWVGWGYKL